MSDYKTREGTLPEPTQGPVAEPVRRPTLKTIAYMTGLGVTTVSRALHDAPDIGRATKERVRTVADQIGYRPNRAGVRLRTGKNNVIALIIDVESEGLGLNSQLIYGVTEGLAGTPYNLNIAPYDLRSDPLGPVRYIVESGSSDGLILSRTEPQDRRVRYLLERNFPVVTYGRTELEMPHAYVDFDNDRFAELCVNRLAGMGRQRIAFINPPPHLTFARHMSDGFSRGVERNGLVGIPVRGVTLDSPHEQIQEEITRMMEGPKAPDGFVCGSGVSALAVIAGAEAAGRVIGRDFDVATKEAFSLMRRFRPAIQVAQEDFRAAGRRLATYLLRRIEGEPIEALQWLDPPDIWEG